MNIIDKATNFSAEFEFNTTNSYHLEELVRSRMLERTIDFIVEETRETIKAIEDGNQAEIIDGFGDIAYLALNGIYKAFRTAGNDHLTAKVKTLEVMIRICDANLAKKHPDGSIIYSNNGKVQKPAGWQPPNYDDLL